MTDDTDDQEILPTLSIFVVVVVLAFFGTGRPLARSSVPAPFLQLLQLNS